jgi:RNA polymerase sigma-70 factor, ECF subfamily
LNKVENKHPIVGTLNLMEIEDDAPSDEELMGRIARRDEHAFEILVRRHRTRILNLIYRTIGERRQAEDLTQELFLRVWRAAKDYRPKARFTTWVYRIAVNLCRDVLKSAHHRQSFVYPYGGDDKPDENEEVIYGPDGVKSPEEMLLAAEKSRSIFAALRNLPANQRMAVVLKKFDGLSYDEISRIMGCSLSAVESLIVRAKRTLREKLLHPGS